MSEQTVLTPAEEAQFRHWAVTNKIGDIDHKASRYDYRGYWKQTHGAKHAEGEHFPDTFKQHGHPSFSQESKYSAGPFDGGRWTGADGEQFVPNGADLLMNARGQSRLSADAIGPAIQALLGALKKGQQ